MASDHSSRFHGTCEYVTTRTDVLNCRQAAWTSSQTTLLLSRSRRIDRDVPTSGADTLCYHVSPTGYSRWCCNGSTQFEVIRTAL